MQTDAVAVSPSLATALETLRARGLALRRGSDPEPIEGARASIPTGHPALDEALGTGGWPRGAVALLDAPAGGGGTTLAMTTLAATQAAAGLVAWLDLDGTFDPAVAARLGIHLEWLLVARPRDPGEAIDLAGWLAARARRRRIAARGDHQRQDDDADDGQDGTGHGRPPSCHVNGRRPWTRAAAWCQSLSIMPCAGNPLE